MSDHTPKRMGVSEARNNLTEVVNEVRLLGRPVMLTRRDKPQAVIVSTEYFEQVRRLESAWHEAVKAGLVSDADLDN